MKYGRECVLFCQAIYKRTAIAASSQFQYSTWDVTEMEAKRVAQLAIKKKRRERGGWRQSRRQEDEAELDTEVVVGKVKL